jgi:L-threonylcarbamoyladenylate synthase
VSKQSEAADLERTLSAGGLAIIPTDTVYGVACSPENEEAFKRLTQLKGRDEAKPLAVMFFDLSSALQTIQSVGERTSALLNRLLPGQVTVLIPNPLGLYPLACRGNLAVLGLRVPSLPGELSALEALKLPILQSSANYSGSPDPKSISEIPDGFQAGVDLIIDGGTLAGSPSTVIDLGEFEQTGRWRILREGALTQAEVERAIGS